MPHTRVKFTKGHEEGVAVKGWHLYAKGIASGEFTACGLSVVDYDGVKKELVQNGGISCEDCLHTIKYFKSIKL
jgi:hypothetical protein